MLISRQGKVHCFAFKFFWNLFQHQLTTLITRGLKTKEVQTIIKGEEIERLYCLVSKTVGQI